MFGAFRRAKAVSVVKTMLNQTLAPLTAFGQIIPGSIYEDPYILGYLTAISGFGTEMATQGKLSVDDIGRVSIEAFHAIAGANGRIAVENTIRFSTEQNRQFREGQRQANRMIEVMYGQLGPDDDPEIAEAFSVVSKMGTFPQGANNPQTVAAAYLSQIHFTNYVRTNHPS